MNKRTNFRKACINIIPELVVIHQGGHESSRQTQRPKDKPGDFELFVFIPQERRKQRGGRTCERNEVRVFLVAGMAKGRRGREGGRRVRSYLQTTDARHNDGASHTRNTPRAGHTLSSLDVP